MISKIDCVSVINGSGLILMDDALSIFRINLDKGNDQERDALYNKVFSDQSIIGIASDLGYILPNSAKLIHLDITKDKTNPDHTKYKIIYGRIWWNRINSDEKHKFGFLSILGPRGGHSTVLWFDCLNRTIYHYDPLTVRPALEAAKILEKLFSGWTIIGTDHKYLVQREEFMKNEKTTSRCKDYFCTWWCLLYLEHMLKGFSHEQSCESANYSALLGLIIRICINYRKVLEWC